MKAQNHDPQQSFPAQNKQQIINVIDQMMQNSKNSSGQATVDMAAKKQIKDDTPEEKDPKSAECRSSCQSVNLEEDSQESVAKSQKSSAIVSKKLSKPSVDKFKGQ